MLGVCGQQGIPGCSLSLFPRLAESWFVFWRSSTELKCWSESKARWCSGHLLESLAFPSQHTVGWQQGTGAFIFVIVKHLFLTGQSMPRTQVDRRKTSPYFSSKCSKEGRSPVGRWSCRGGGSASGWCGRAAPGTWLCSGGAWPIPNLRVSKQLLGWVSNTSAALLG